MAVRQHAIFIGYRRDDSADTAGRIYDRLEAKFGKDHVFKDVDSIPFGEDFSTYVSGVIKQCRIFLPLIGPRWLEARHQGGGRRLDDPGDLVRIEIETAFATPGVRVVPVLLGGASMPSASELPPSLRRLAAIHAAQVRRDPDFRNDMDKLVRDIEPLLSTRETVEEWLRRQPARLPTLEVPPQQQHSGAWRALAAASIVILDIGGFAAYNTLGVPAGESAAQVETVVAETPVVLGGAPTAVNGVSAPSAVRSAAPNAAPHAAPTASNADREPKVTERARVDTVAPIVGPPLGAMSASSTVPARASFIRPTWLVRPSVETLTSAYPTEARKTDTAGQALLNCVVLADGKLACSVISERPEGWGFGSAALTVSAYFKAAPELPDGSLARGKTAQLTISFAPD
ncbi:MAG TPA: toll/interleukin-1 receptor domain-containing protein [Caulobacterales bacterium]|nr:toll/interleukin-1 receptor domain-containing protein [Caulobacterales bacterium]